MLTVYGDVLVAEAVTAEVHDVHVAAGKCKERDLSEGRETY